MKELKKRKKMIMRNIINRRFQKMDKKIDDFKLEVNKKREW